MCRELLNLWELPKSFEIGGETLPINWDYRVILQILQVFEDANLPLFARWRKALRLFYGAAVSPHHRQEAMEKMADFISYGQVCQPGPKLISWQQDAPLIVAQINQVAGYEIRERPLHWWTFLGYFHAIGQGPLCQVVALREKLRSGKKLDEGERAFYSKYKDMVRLPDDPAVKAQKERLEKLLKGGSDATKC